MRKLAFIGAGVVIVAAGLFAYRSHAVPPSCSDPATIALATKGLIEQFKFPASITVTNIRTSQGGFLASRVECDGTIEGDLGQTSVEPVHFTSEYTDDKHQHYVTAQPTFPMSQEVPLVSCDSDGQVGFRPGPKDGKPPVKVSPWAARYLAYYATEDLGVLGPRGWHCVGLYGSSGSSIFVAPTPLKSDEFFKRGYHLAGPAIQLSLSMADSSGRFSVAKVAARLFPTLKGFVKQVVAEGIEPESDFPSGPYPTDKVTRQNDYVVFYETPANTEGMGTNSLLAKNGDPISGTAIMVEDALVQLNVRLPGDFGTLIPEIISDTQWRQKDHLLKD